MLRLNLSRLMVFVLGAIAVSWSAGLAAQGRPTRMNPTDGLVYVHIPAGTFLMGCSEGDKECGEKEKPAHQVTLTRDFWIGQTEVTVAAYKRFAAATGRAMPPDPSYSARSAVTFQTNPGWNDDSQPMVRMGWHEATQFCAWAGGRLPTEAEWEYAARAGEKGVRYGSVDDIAWYAANSGRTRLNMEIFPNQRDLTPHLAPNGCGTKPVGTKAPNQFGLHDVLGNAFEWVADWYAAFGSEPLTDPTGPAEGTDKVVRSSSFGAGPWAMRLSVRSSDHLKSQDPAAGFRCALDMQR